MRRSTVLSLPLIKSLDWSLGNGGGGQSSQFSTNISLDKSKTNLKRVDKQTKKIIAHIHPTGSSSS